MDDNKLSTNNVSKDNSRKSASSIASFVLSLAPIVILLMVFLFCLIISGGSFSDNDRGAIWWLFITVIMVLIPVAIVTNILAIIFGVIGLKRKKTAFAWSGIIIVALEGLAVLVIWVLLR